MKLSATKYLRINRYDSAYTTYEHVPGYLHPQLIPNAKCYTDIDRNGVIIDQKIELEELSIYYHLVYLEEGVKLTTISPNGHLLPACISGFSEYNAPTTPMKMVLAKNERNAAEAGTLITGREFVINFHVNLNLSCLECLKTEFPDFEVIAELGMEKIRNLAGRLSFSANEVNHLLMKRITGCKLIGRAADIFFRRSAIDFYTTYLRYLRRPLPVMLHEKQQQQLREIVNYIIQYPSDAGSAEALCRRFDVAPAFLKAPFEQQYLISVEALILQEKMALAYKLITETNHTLTYIANLTKYNSWEELSKAFESYYKCSVAELRKAQ
jgi:AraC-like DNA-binding protein